MDALTPPVIDNAANVARYTAVAKGFYWGSVALTLAALVVLWLIDDGTRLRGQALPIFLAGWLVGRLQGVGRARLQAAPVFQRLIGLTAGTR